MSGGRVIAFIVAVLMLIGLVMVFADDEKAKEIDWNERYRAGEKEPYDTYVIGKMLEDYFPQHSFQSVQKPLKKMLDAKAHGNYIAIAENFYWSQQDIDSLLSFVRRGNKAFICSYRLPNELMKSIDQTYDGTVFSETYYPTVYSDSALKIYAFANAEKYLKLEHKLNNITVPGYWKVMPESYTQRFHAQNLGFVENTINDSLNIHFSKITLGKGELYMHCLPIAFSNYYQITKEGKAYAETVFSYLNNDDIYWDEISQYPINDFAQSEKSPLSFILAQVSLKWAWYLSLILVLLFILFRAKRKQKVIAVLEPNMNTSIMFIETIGKLYYLQNNHRKIALYKMKHFQYFVRKRYQINIAKNESNVLLLLADASGISIEKINEIVKKYQHIKALDNIDKEHLMEFYLLIQEFYKKCK